MQRVRLIALGTLTVAACSLACQGAGAQGAPPRSALSSGIDTQYEDSAVRPQDDTYRYLNGKWLDTFQIPADKGSYTAFTIVDDRTQEQLHGIVDALAAPGTGAYADPDAQKLADLYASFMDEARLQELGLKPLAPTLAAIDALKKRADLPALIARFNRTGITAPYDFGVAPDPRDSSRYAVSLQQSGLGMPDRDYYLKDDAKLKEARAKYLVHVATMLRMSGDGNSEKDAAAILKLESSIAELQWTRVANRDPVKTYNKFAIAELATLTPGYRWRRYLQDSGLEDKIGYVIVAQPSYLKGLNALMAETPLGVWRAYFRWHALAAAAPYLSKPWVDERFAFTGTVLRGIPQNRPRWKRGLALLDRSMGEALGKLYVAKYFPPQNKERMDALVRNLIKTYSRDIDTLEWMGESTKQGAHAKLEKLMTKIGYPSKWRDYGALRIARDDLWGNVMRATEFESQRQIDKLGKPIDRSEWFMSPQTVNAYYNPVMNEIVFPAAILQPPYFDFQADDAVNYGSIGGVIGHEVSHAFDDEGSQYDADGNLHDWFTPEDHERFAAKTKALVAQYDAYEPVPGFHLNGALTLGENIADNSGLTIAYQAYHLSLEGAAAPLIDGMSGDQRFYLGWVQVWRGKAREAEAIQRIKTDPHSPSEVRGKAPLRNQPGFYGAFDLKPQDKMYLAPAERVIIW